MRLLLFNMAMDMDYPLLEFTSHWVRALARQAAFIHVITMRAGRIEVPENVMVYSVGKERGYSKPRRLVQFYRHLLRVLREDKIDVCFSHMIPIFTVLAAPMLKAKGVPIVTWYAHPSVTWLLKLAHCLSSHMVTSVAAAYPYRRDKLMVVGQGIDTALFSPDDGMSSKDQPIILCVGRLSPVKDHPTLFKAVWLLRQRWNKPFRVTVLGSPVGPQDEPYVRSLHEQVKKLGLEDTIYFEPPVAMVSLPSWYRQCTVYVNMTPTGSGDKVALEAMSCGKICLTANEGFRETLGEYANHLLFQNGDVEGLAQRLLVLLMLSDIDRKHIGLYLRQRVAQMHNLDKLITNLIRIFQVDKGCNDQGISIK